MSLPLRYPRVWLCSGWLLVALALFVSLSPSGVPGLHDVNDKLMHVVGYLGLTIWFTGIYPRSRYAVIGVGLLLMGIGVEIAQHAMHAGRRAEFADVIADVIGIAIGLALAWSACGGWAQRIESWVVRP